MKHGAVFIIIMLLVQHVWCAESQQNTIQLAKSVYEVAQFIDEKEEEFFPRGVSNDAGVYGFAKRPGREHEEFAYACGQTVRLFLYDVYGRFENKQGYAFDIYELSHHSYESTSDNNNTVKK